MGGSTFVLLFALFQTSDAFGAPSGSPSVPGPSGIFYNYVPGALMGGMNATSTPFFSATYFKSFLAKLELNDAMKVYNLTLYMKATSTATGALNSPPTGFVVTVNQPYFWNGQYVQSYKVPTANPLPFCSETAGAIMYAISQPWQYHPTLGVFTQPFPSMFHCQIPPAGSNGILDAKTQPDPYGKEFDMLTGFKTSVYRYFNPDPAVLAAYNNDQPYSMSA